MEVEERQAEQQSIRPRPAPCNAHCLSAREEVAMCEHGALGLSSGPRRVADCRQVIRLAPIETRSFVGIRELDFRRYHIDASRPHIAGAGIFLFENGQSGPSVRQEVLDFTLLISSVSL